MNKQVWPDRNDMDFDTPSAWRWFLKPNRALSGDRSFNLLEQLEGLEQVETLLFRISEGLIS